MQQISFLFILLSLLNMFRAIISTIFRSTLTVYTAVWNNAPTLLPTGDTVEMELCHRSAQQGRCIVPKSRIYSQSALEDGRNYCPKHVEQA
jgi:hypothetical protein